MATINKNHRETHHPQRVGLTGLAKEEGKKTVKKQRKDPMCWGQTSTHSRKNVRKTKNSKLPGVKGKQYMRQGQKPVRKEKFQRGCGV